MERLIQYLDDLEDLFYAVALAAERARRFGRLFLVLLSGVAFQISGIVIALIHPPMALGLATMVGVCLFYNTVVRGARRPIATN